MHNCKSRIEYNLLWGAKPATGRYWYSTRRHNGGSRVIGVLGMSLERVVPGSEE